AIKDIYHISNYNSELTSFDRNEVNAILKDKKQLYDFVTKFRPKSDIEYFKRFIDEILMMSGFDCFMKDGELNPYMVDDFVNKERVKKYYRNKDGLINTYDESIHFNVTGDSGYIYYNISDQDLASITDTTSTLTVNDKISMWTREIMSETSGKTNFGLVMLMQ